MGDRLAGVLVFVGCCALSDSALGWLLEMGDSLLGSIRVV